MLSNQMLSGIPEVDLGIDAKIRNIEATEEAKQKLLEDQMKKRNEPTDMVPTNMASNFMLHSRCKYLVCIVNVCWKLQFPPSVNLIYQFHL